MPYSFSWPEALARALAAAERGLYVFPLTSGKLPAVRSPHPGLACRGECGRPGHGVHDAATDVDRVRELFRLAPHATGYGIACGRPPAHLIGVDLDRKNGVDGVTALRELARRHSFAIPATVTVSTPSGGLHLWLSGPANVTVPNSASRIAPGIDVRGSGGYLVGPGSRTTKGTYRELPEGAPDAARIPAALLQLLLPTPEPARRRTPAPRSNAPGADSALVQFVRDAPEGQLNNRLFWAACRAYEQHADADSVADALLDAACQAGHPERGAARTIASARSRIRGRAVR